MFAWWLQLRSYFGRDEGQDLVEYAMLSGFISIMAVLAVTVVGLNNLVLWDKLAAMIGAIL